MYVCWYSYPSNPALPEVLPINPVDTLVPVCRKVGHFLFFSYFALSLFFFFFFFVQENTYSTPPVLCLPYIIDYLFNMACVYLHFHIVTHSDKESFMFGSFP